MAKSREEVLAYNRRYYQENKDRCLAKQKEWREANKDRVSDYGRARYEATKDSALAERKERYTRKRSIEREQQRLYREANREQIRQQQRDYRIANKEELNKKCRERRASDPESYRRKERARRSSPEVRAERVNKTREWVKNNKERHLEWSRCYRKKRAERDPVYKASIAMRRRFYMAVHNQVYDGWDIRSGEAVRLLGCTIKEFVSYIESLWTDGMSWENWSRDGWHIDHIIPLASFDLADEDQRLKACHFSNLRPLWAKENMSKGSKVFESIN